MTKRAVLGTFVIALLTFAPLASAVAENLLVSGQTALFTVDGNGDGPGSGDCVLNATRILGGVTINSVQDTSIALLLCAMTLSGTSFEGSDASSDYFGIDLTSSVPAACSLPLRVEFVDEEGTPNGLPATLDDPFPVDGVFLSDPALPGDSAGGGALCDAGGGTLALKGREQNGISFLLAVQLYPNGTSPTHVLIRGLRFQLLASPDTRVTRDAYVRINSNRTLTLAGSDSPNALLINIDLNNLPPCGGRTTAPSLTEWGLAAIRALPRRRHHARPGDEEDDAHQAEGHPDPQAEERIDMVRRIQQEADQAAVQLSMLSGPLSEQVAQLQNVLNLLMRVRQILPDSQRLIQLQQTANNRLTGIKTQLIDQAQAALNRAGNANRLEERLAMTNDALGLLELGVKLDPGDTTLAETLLTTRASSSDMQRARQVVERASALIAQNFDNELAQARSMLAGLRDYSQDERYRAVVGDLLARYVERAARCA